MSNINGLYGVTVDNDPQTPSKVQEALIGGATVIQFRNKTAQIGVKATAQCLRNLCQQYGATFIINDDLELALAVNADGVHLGKQDTNIKTAREKLGNKIIGVSCYNKLELAIDAEQQGADYVAFGRFFPSITKPEALSADINLLRIARKKLSLPIVAIGGITTHNAALLVDAGADAIAVINGLFEQQNIKDTAQAFSNLFQKHNKGLE